MQPRELSRKSRESRSINRIGIALQINLSKARSHAKVPQPSIVGKISTCMFHPSQHKAAVMPRLEAFQSLTTILSCSKIILITSTHTLTLNKPISTIMNRTFNAQRHLIIYGPGEMCSFCTKPYNQCLCNADDGPSETCTSCGKTYNLCWCNV